MITGIWLIGNQQQLLVDWCSVEVHAYPIPAQFIGISGWPLFTVLHVVILFCFLQGAKNDAAAQKGLSVRKKIYGAWKSVYLDYEMQWPLSLLLPPAVMQLYNKLFQVPLLSPILQLYADCSFRWTRGWGHG